MPGSVPHALHSSWALLACVVLMSTTEAAAAAPASELTAGDWRQDLAFAREEMPKRHANLFHALSRENYEAAFERLEVDVDHLAPHQIIVRLAEIVAAVGDGHSRLTLPLDPAAGLFATHTGSDTSRVSLFHQYPVRLSRLTDGYIVTRTDARHRELLGARLVAIDGHVPAEIEARLAPAVQRDNSYQLQGLVPLFMVIPEVMQAVGLVADVQTSNWSVEGQEGRIRSVRLEPVPVGTRVEWQQLAVADDRPRPTGSDGRKLWFASLQRPAAIYVRVAEIADDPSRSFEAFAAELQHALAETGLRCVILDLRGNTGGDNSLNAPLVRALVRTPWVSEPGALFVLVDSGTFSAAMNLAEDLERWLPAVFVGDGTGGRPNSYGDARKLVLPRSGLTIRLSSLYWQNHPLDERPAIVPLIEVRATRADLLAGRDPVLTRLGELDDGQAGLAGAWVGLLAVPFQQVAMTLDDSRAAAASVGSVVIPALGVEAGPVRALTQAGENWYGELGLTTRTVVLAMRPSGPQLIGWIDYRGSHYPFVLQRRH
jgi:hypothetical protein